MQSHAFFKAKSNFSLFGLSNEVLGILVPQRATKLPEVKVWRSEKNLGLKPRPHSSGARLSDRIFFIPPTLTFGSFAFSCATRMHSISFGSIIFSFKKEFESTFRVLFFSN